MMAETKLVLLGETGVGKSTLGNKVLGKEVFRAGSNLTSETKIANKQSGSLFGNAEYISVIDTQGLNDAEGTDYEHTKQLINLLKREGYISAFILVLNGQETRWKSSTWSMLELFTNMYPNFWNKVIVLVNFWPTDEKSIKRRKQADRNEQVLRDSITEQLRGRISRNIHVRIEFCDAHYDVDSANEKKAFEDTIRNLIILARSFDQTDTLNLKAMKTKQDELADNYNNLQNEIKENEKKHQNEITNLKKQAEETEERLKKQHEQTLQKEISSVKDQHSKQIEEVKNQATEAEKRLKSEFDMRFSQMDQSYQQELRMREMQLKMQADAQQQQLSMMSMLQQAQPSYPQQMPMQMPGGEYPSSISGRGSNNILDFDDDFGMLSNPGHKSSSRQPTLASAVPSHGSNKYADVIESLGIQYKKDGTVDKRTRAVRQGLVKVRADGQLDERTLKKFK
eukprot:TRINITY_DN3432_c0_g3_i2.p1 TRINITY_DN3432_c0_g3~~TRINITY_DN3432_c0_g3_i2.p1  ORF type:complete len:453 (-),score=83.89 TRINITY_DN3432_c0_g3_i2:145-1503(-)